MLHVLLVILKIIGMILAVLLGLILLLLLLALFVPIRYKGSLRKEENLEIKGRASWLLRLINVPIVYQNGELSVKIKLLGITVKKLLKDGKDLREDTEELFEDGEDEVLKGEERLDEQEKAVHGTLRKTEKEERDALTSDISDKKISGNGISDSEDYGPAKGEREQGKTESGTEDKARAEREEAGQAGMRKEPKASEGRPESSRIKRIWEKIKAFFLKLFGIWKKIKNLKYTFGRFCAKIRRGIQKYRNTKEFLLDERTKEAWELFFSQVKLLIRKLLPKKLRGELRFGAEDPALTGEILGGVSIFYPVFMDNVKVYPNFEQSILEGELFVKGSFRTATAALIFWRLWRDKNIRYVYQTLKGGFAP